LEGVVVVILGIFFFGSAAKTIAKVSERFRANRSSNGILADEEAMI
jgi:hypothetical protein